MRRTITTVGLGVLSLAAVPTVTHAQDAVVRTGHYAFHSDPWIISGFAGWRDAWRLVEAYWLRWCGERGIGWRRSGGWRRTSGAEAGGGGYSKEIFT